MVDSKQDPTPNYSEDIIADIRKTVDAATAAKHDDTEKQQLPKKGRTLEETPWWERIPPGANEKEIAAAAAISLGVGTAPVSAEGTAAQMPVEMMEPEREDSPVPFDEATFLSDVTTYDFPDDDDDDDGNNTATQIAFNGDGKATTMDVPMVNPAEKDGVNTAPSPSNDQTFVSNSSQSDNASDDSPKKAAKAKRTEPANNTSPSHLGIYFVCIFLVVSAAVLVPLLVFTDVFASGTTSSSSSSATALETNGGLPIPSPVPVENPFLPRETIIVIASPTDPPTAAPTTLTPTVSDATPFPTSAPATPNPTAPPSDPPTPGPSMQPTPLPTAAPTPRPSPTPTAPPTSPFTESPTNSPSSMLDTPLFSYLAALGTPESVLEDPTTPQGQAFRWLMGPNIQQETVFRVPQRYALVALDFALHGSTDGTSSSWRRDDADMCDWRGVTCDALNEVIEIKWSNQGLSGSIIPELKLLKKLETVDLAQNSISGGLDVFWDLPSLTHLYLFENNFSGAIPSDRSAPTGLVRVYLGSNLLTGPLPLTLTSSRSGPQALRYLSLYDNQLSGALPSGMRLRKLFYLDLSNNSFSGSLPSDFVENFVLLRILYLGNNYLSGDLPDNFAFLGSGRMKQLFISDNSFTGEFPTGWSDTAMTNMDISRNSFDSADKKFCKINVFEEGELIEYRADCEICECKELCHTCT